MNKTNDNLSEVIFGYISSKSLMIAAKLDLDMRLVNPKSVSVLTQELNFNPVAFKKFLRVLDAYGIVKYDGETVSSTELTKILPYLKSPHVIDAYLAINELEASLQTNKSSWSKVYGKEFFPYILEHDEKLRQFSQWCDITAINWLSLVFSLYEFGGFDTVADIGGGTGYLICELLKRNSKQRGILFEQDKVIEQARIKCSDRDISSRLQFVSGDFFQSVPLNANCYILCRTLLNWSDDDAIKILNKCYLSMPENAVLIIADFIIPNISHPLYKAVVLNDINLLSVFNSSNRTLFEWEALIAQSELRLKRKIVSSDENLSDEMAPMVILECMKN